MSPLAIAFVINIASAPAIASTSNSYQRLFFHIVVASYRVGERRTNNSQIAFQHECSGKQWNKGEFKPVVRVEAFHQSGSVCRSSSRTSSSRRVVRLEDFQC